MKNVVYVMGTPCSGKSTILKLWNEMGGVVIPEFMDPVPEFVHNSWLGDDETRLQAEQWALNQNIRKNELIADLNFDGTVLVERSPLDVLAYARAFGGPAKTWTERAVAGRKWQPGKLVLLRSNLDILKDRWMSGRGLSEHDWINQWKPLSESLFTHYEQIQKMFGVPEVSTEGTYEQTLHALFVSIERSRTYSLEGMVNPPSYKERRK